MGDNFTVADAYAFTIMYWTNFVSIDLKPYPNIVTYISCTGARPKVLEALKAERLAKYTMARPRRDVMRACR